MSDAEVVAAQLDRWQRARNGHQAWAETARACVDFFEGRQWDPADVEILREEGRPVLTLNKIAPLVRLVLGFFRQVRYEVRFLPANDGVGYNDVAELLTATVKQIAEANQSEWNDAQVFQDGIMTGRGFWDVRLAFDRNPLGAVRETVLDPFSVYLDPEAESYDPSGWSYVAVNRWLSLEDILVMYGPPAAWAAAGAGEGGALDGGWDDDPAPERWFGLQNHLDQGTGTLVGGAPVSDHVNRQRRLIRVLDCQHRQLRRVRCFMDLATGTQAVVPDHFGPDRIRRVVEWSRAHGIDLDVVERVRRVVRWTVTAADRVLYDAWSPYNDVTVVPYFPYFRRGKTKGMIEDLLDPQREINKRRSALLHIINTTANSGWVYEENSLREDMKEALETEGARPGINIEYRAGGRPPTRIQPAAPPSSFKLLEQTAVMDLKEISGINDSALGQLDRVQSGRAIEARQRQSIIGAEVYFDNFGRSRELKGRRMLDLIQTYYTEPRLVRIRGERGVDREMWINRRDAAGEVVNNVTLGRYDVAVEQAPVSATFLQGQLEEALEMRRMGVPIPDDVLIDLSTLPSRGEIKRRLEERKSFNDMMMRLEAMGQKQALGVPLDLAPPPVVSDEGANVITPPAEDAETPAPVPPSPQQGDL